MNKKISLFITTAAILACFANAQTSDPAAEAPSQEAAVVQEQIPQAEPAPAATQEQATPAPVAQEQAPQTNSAQTTSTPVAAPAPTQEINEPAQQNQPSQITFYSTSSQPITVYKQAPVQTQAVSTQPLPQQVVQPVRPPKPKRTMHFGIQGAIGSTEYVGDSVDDMEDGMTWNAGLYASLPLTDRALVAEIGAKALYRQVSNSTANYYDEYDKRSYPRKNKITAYSLGIPLLLNIYAPNTELFFTVGPQIEIPLSNQLEITFNGDKRVDEDLVDNQCAPISWDLVLGIGFNATSHFALEANITIGVTDIYDDLLVDNEYWNYTPVDVNLGVKFFL